MSKEVANNSAVEVAVVDLGEGAISDILEDMRADILFVARDPSLLNYFKDSSRANKSHFTQDLLNFALSHPIYDQVRWLDEDGMELVRVNKGSAGPILVRESDLQNKKDRYYFSETLSLAPGQIFVSPIDLNIEHGKIEIPLKPTMRIGVPIVDNHGRKRGIVILNYLGDHLFSRFDSFIRGHSEHVMLLNKDGYFLKSANQSDAWGFMFGRSDLTLSQRFPEAWERIASASKGQFINSDGLWTFSTDYPASASGHATLIGTTSSELEPTLPTQARQWRVVSHLPTAKLLEQTNLLLLKLYFVVALLTLGSFVISWKLVQGHFRRLAETSTRIAATVFESKQGMIVTDENSRILRVNQAFTEITGYTSKDVVGRTPGILSSGKHDADFYRNMWEDLKTKDKWEGEIWNRRKNGQVFPEYLTISAVKTSSSQITNYVGTFNDITSIKHAEEKIEHLALYDQLTDLPNRRLMLDRLRQALSSSVRSSKRGAIFYIDVNGFRSLNDSIGHEMGNILLQRIAERLLGCVRSGDTLSRVGGDEFVLVLVDLGNDPIETGINAESMAEKLHAALNRPFKLGLSDYHCSIAIGATLFDGGDNDPNSLVDQAEIAMYKKAGSDSRSGLQFFDSQMQVSVSERAAMEIELHVALDKNQFELYYQIQVDERNLPVGAESLIRWNNPNIGVVSPARFIPLAEETGLILPLGLWVLEAACEQLKIWEQGDSTRHLVLAINVSPKSFRQNTFASEVTSAVVRHAINPNLLKLELTESMMLDRVDETIAKMTELKAVGIQFSMDDFGTGYSSLQYLKLLPINQLKIDQAFVRDIATDENDRVIASTIISMGKSLQLDVIAEGVETNLQRDLLIKMGCHHFQGYLFSKPVPIDIFDALVKRV